MTYSSLLLSMCVSKSFLLGRITEMNSMSLEGISVSSSSLETLGTKSDFRIETAVPGGTLSIFELVVPKLDDVLTMDVYFLGAGTSDIGADEIRGLGEDGGAITADVRVGATGNLAGVFLAAGITVLVDVMVVILTAGFTGDILTVSSVRM